MILEKKIVICGIPAIIYGERSDKAFIYVHGKCGYKEEGKDFAELACKKGFQVLSFDLPEHGERKDMADSFNPWCAVPELKNIYSYAKSHWSSLGLRANSIGAWFSMQAFDGNDFFESLFVSPVVDMKKLIDNMMTWANVTPQMLEKDKVIKTNFGEDLSWKYYQYALNNPTKWCGNIHVLYASKDNLTSKDTIDTFCKDFSAYLTVMDNGEHWFHTPEQISVLNSWTEKIL